MERRDDLEVDCGHVINRTWGWTKCCMWKRVGLRGAGFWMEGWAIPWAGDNWERNILCRDRLRVPFRQARKKAG